MPRPPTAILANDNLHLHDAQRGVLRVFLNTVEALSRSFGPALLVCSPRRYPGLAARQRLIPRLPGRLGNRLHRRVPTHDALVSAVAALVRPGAIYSPYYGNLRTRAPQAFTVHDLIYERFPAYFPPERHSVRALIAEKRRCFERAALLLPNSETTARDLRAVYPQLDPAKIVPIPLGVEEVFFTPPAPIAAPRPYLLFAGNRSLYKNFLALVHAYARSGLADRYDLRAFSPGPPRFSREERAAIGRYGLESRVLLTAAPSDEGARDLYASAAALVYPSLFEGFGLPVLEAMACGTVVAASDTSSLPEVGGDVAIYFDPHSVNAIAAALVQVAALSDEARRDLAARGRARAAAFTWARFQARTAEAFRRLLAPPA